MSGLPRYYDRVVATEGPLRVIFLDIDGVVLPFDVPTREAQLDCARRVNELAKLARAKVVISSSWRGDAVAEVGDDNWRSAHLSPAWRGQWYWLTTVAGLDVEVIGVTPVFGSLSTVEPGVRGEEILAWLSEHPEVTSWIAIDDWEIWLGPKLNGRCVITEGKRIGFDEKSLQKALKLFGVEND